MSLFRWNRLARAKARPASAGVDGLLTADELGEAIERERMRADRTGTPFAVLVFHLGRTDRPPEMERALAYALTSRLRATDVAGRRAGGGIAALLPGTQEAGAQVLAGHVCAALAAEGVRLRHEVFLYPHREPGAPLGLGQSPVTGAMDAAQPQSVETWFVQPLPFWKRGLDLFGATVGLIVTAPLLLAAALAIKLTSPGPIFFTQRRTGLGGRVFTLYKLRTMCIEAESLKAALRAQSEQDGPAFKMVHDPRVTRVGRYLRKACIDELPQLWNVIKGDMSLVGPRPLPCDEASLCAGWQQRRLHVTPGLTCTWQLLGGMRVPFPEWMRMDLRYAKSRRPWRDLVLIVRTVLVAITHRASH